MPPGSPDIGDVFAIPDGSPLFGGAPEPQLRAMLSGCETQELAAGARLLSAGEPNDVLYIVLTGGLSVRLPGAARPTVPVPPGGCVGELSLLDGSPVSADVVAEVETLVLAVESEHLWLLLEHAPVVARNLLRILAGRVRNDNRMLQEADRVQRRYEKAATIDALTGLRNRRWLNEAFARQLQRAARAGRPVSLLMIDADHFKRVNDTWGHLVGDEVLTHLGRTLAGRLRPQDLLARYGGEEFAVLLPDVTASVARAAAERLRSAVDQSPPRTSAGVLSGVTISIGVATTEPLRDVALQPLIEQADHQLAAAKEAGRNCVRG